METRTPHRLAAAATALVLSASLAACGGNGGSTADGPVEVNDSNNAGAMADYGVGDTFQASEPFTVTTLFSDHPNYPYNADWLFWQEIEDRTNVTLDATIVPMSDYEQKRSLVVSAGDAPTIIPKTYPGQESAFVSSGAILPVSDYVDLMPNYQDKVEKWDMADNIETLKQSDGKYYVLPGLHEEVWPDYTLIWRKDLLEANGIAEPQTWDEVYDALVKLKAATGQTPFSDRYQGKNLLGILGTAYGTTAGWAYSGGVTFNEAEDAFEFSAQTDEYKDMVTYLNRLVTEGLLDPQSFTQQDDQALQAFRNGNTAVISGNSQDPSAHREIMDQNIGAGNYEIGKGILPGGPAGDVMTNSRLENGIMINANILDSPNFVATMQFIDWLWYSDEGQEFTKWGVEGTTYTKATDGTRTLDPGITYVWMNPGAPKKLNADYGFSGGNFAYGGTTDLLQSMFAPEEKEWQERMAAEREPAPVQPPYPFDDLEREQVTLLQTPLKDFVEQETLKFATGQRDMSEWDAFQTDLAGRGVDQYLEMVNTAYERAKNA
ncbi:extracellular solute-binding protein [Propioniciclava soli]|uniref:Extracellular solute-binding protein n=1 Tax=Propioniciclava soli TaxID=2775081 RepID=A0ABZ3C7H6_9ACTN